MCDVCMCQKNAGERNEVCALCPTNLLCKNSCEIDRFSYVSHQCTCIIERRLIFKKTNKEKGQVSVLKELGSDS